jgi:valyl-tRNA synthetase
MVDHSTQEFEYVREVITEMRKLRAQYGKKGEKLKVNIPASERQAEILRQESKLIERMTKCELVIVTG